MTTWQNERAGDQAGPVPTPRSAITTHVLDLQLGRPGIGVAVTLDEFDDGAWRTLGEAVTDADGRVHSIGPLVVRARVHRLTFDTGAYFASRSQEHFFPVVGVSFAVSDPTRHHHVPVVLSPFGYSTYRGS